MKRRLPMSPRRRKKPQIRPEFKAHSRIGTIMSQDRMGKDRPPRSAKLVAELDMGSTPGSGDFRIYLLCTNRERSSWILWLDTEDENGAYNQFVRIATGRPYRGYPAKFAAEQLLTKAWQEERDIEAKAWHDIDPAEALVMNAGLLNQEDISPDQDGRVWRIGSPVSPATIGETR